MDEFDKPIEATPPDNRRGVPGRRGAPLGILHEWKARLKQIKGEIEAARTRPNYDPTSRVIKRWTDEELKLETQIAEVDRLREARKELELAKLRVGKNIDKLRKECGWSFDDLRNKTGIDKKLILSHVHGKSSPTPRLLKEYAQAFTRELKRQITPNNLEE